MAPTAITRARLRRLGERRPERGRVLSVFLNLDPSELPTPPARASAITSVMTDAARRIEQAEGLDHEERAALRADVERVRQVLEGSDIAANGTRGLAIYACGPADLLEIVQLPYPVEPRVALERAPYVEPLVTAQQETWCVLLANRRSARLFRGDGGGLQETDRIEDDVHRQHDQGGWSQARYQRSVDKEKDDHITHTLDVLFTGFKRRPFDHLLVGAPGELVGEVEQRMHPYLRERLAGRITLDVENSTVEQVRESSAAAIERHVQAREREALDRLVQGVGAGGRGAAGLSQVLAALNEARVEILLLEDGFHAPGFRDPETGVLSDREGPEPCEDIVEPAIEKAIEQSATVLVVRHHADLGPLGRVGAVLRY
jgi:peptide chain release factor subunit 1